MLGGGYNPLATSASALSYQTSVDQSFTINDTLTIILSDDKVSIDNLLPGQSADSSILDVTVLSNNPYGYKLTGTVGDSNYTADALYNNGDNTKTFTSIGYGNNKSTLNDFDANTWGYSYSLDGGTTWQGSAGNTGYTGLPLYNSSNTMTFLDTDDISASTGDTMKFKIGAKASSTKESGEYNNTINFVATGYSFPLYTITYNANGGTVSPTSETTRGTSVTLPTPSNGGKIFGGWCDSAIASGTCTGNTYQAGATYTPTGNITLTAMWEAGDFFAISTMQEMTSEICEATTTPLASATRLDTDGSHSGDNTYVPSTTLTDTRGGRYVVRKYADGNCWMAQNLNLSLSTSTTLTNANTDLNSKTSWTPTVNTSSSVPANSSNPTSYTRGNKCCSGTASNTNQTCNTTDTGDQTNHVGIIYNWYAATAMSGTSSMVSPDATNTVDAQDSICPKGWRLPTGGTSNKTNTNGNKYSFYNLLTTKYSVASSEAGSVKMRSNPLSFIFSGYYGSGSLYNEGSNGSYWSSSAYTSSTGAYSMTFSKTYVYLQNNGNKQYGRSIRCVAR